MSSGLTAEWKWEAEDIEGSTHAAHMLNDLQCFSYICTVCILHLSRFGPEITSRTWTMGPASQTTDKSGLKMHHELSQSNKAAS